MKDRREDERTVYLIVNPEGKRYVGVTKDLVSRLRQHMRAVSVVGHSLRHFGREMHRVFVLARLPKDEAFQFEQDAIEQCGSLWPHGLNYTAGGENPPAPKKGRAINSSESQIATGRVNFDRGRKLPKSPEHREKIRQARLRFWAQKRALESGQAMAA